MEKNKGVRKMKSIPKPLITISVNECIDLIDEIESNLIYSVELDISNNICVDIDENNIVTPLLMDGKQICYPKYIYNNFNIVGFDPFFNRKMSQMLLERYLKIYLARTHIDNPDLNIITMFLAPTAFGSNQYMAVIRTNKGDIISNPFINETICWIDLLLKLDDQQYDYNYMKNLDLYICYVREIEMFNKDSGIILDSNEFINYIIELTNSKRKREVIANAKQKSTESI